MKAKRFSVIRPEAVLEVSGFRGWLLLPFFLLRIHSRCIRLFTFNLFGGERKSGKLRILAIPKLTIKRADAS